MIKLIDLLKEFEYGSQLFADPEDENLVNVEFLDNLIAKPEPNTDDEKKLLKALSDYFSGDVVKNIDTSILKKLLQLKSKFPKILDPAKSRNAGLAYRGTTIGIDTLLKATDNGSLFKHSYNVYVIDNPKITIQSKGSTGYLSFTAEIVYAESFAIGNMGGNGYENLLKQKLFPITAEISSKDPNLLFNPVFVRALSGYDEEEILLIDTKYTPDARFLTDPYHILKNLDNQDFPVDPGYYELKKQLEAVGMLTK